MRERERERERDRDSVSLRAYACACARTCSLRCIARMTSVHVQERLSVCTRACLPTHVHHMSTRVIAYAGANRATQRTEMRERGSWTRA